MRNEGRHHVTVWYYVIAADWVTYYELDGKSCLRRNKGYVKWAIGKDNWDLDERLYKAYQFGTPAEARKYMKIITDYFMRDVRVKKLSLVKVRFEYQKGYGFDRTKEKGDEREV